MTVSDFVQLEIPALYKYLNVVTGTLQAIMERVSMNGDQETVTYNVTLAVHEMCTNIIEHAYKEQSGRIQVRVTVEELPYRIIIDLTDYGEPFDWDLVKAPDLDIPQEGNYGLFLATTLMDDVIYQRDGQTNHWKLVKHI